MSERKTAREQAERIVKTYGLTFALASLPPQKHLPEAREHLAAAIAAAIQAERRECSQIATDYGRQVPASRMFADRIAAAISVRQP